MDDREGDSSVSLAALTSASLWLAGLAGATLVLVVLSDWFKGAHGGVYSVGAATGIAAGATIVLSLVMRGAGRPETANSAEYGRLAAELEVLQGRLGTPAPAADLFAQDTSEPDAAGASRAAREEASRQVAAIERELGRAGAPGPLGWRWFLQDGYVALWRRLHRANEALFETVSKTELLRGASGDALRLKTSTIPNKDELLARVSVAAAALGGFPGLTLGSPTTAPTPTTNGETMKPETACALLRDVREAINQFRDDARDGMVRARNRLMWTVLLTGLVIYSLLALAVANGATRSQIVAGTAFYLVGAAVGLGRQLQVAASGQAGKEEDYGLSVIRLAHAPLLSGIAAVGGVVLLAMAPALIPDTSSEVPELAKIFDLGDNRTGLVVAAVFGLTPGLLFKRLQAQAERYSADLASTKAAQAGAPSAGTAEP